MDWYSPIPWLIAFAAVGVWFLAHLCRLSDPWRAEQAETRQRHGIDIYGPWEPLWRPGRRPYDWSADWRSGAIDDRRW